MNYSSEVTTPTEIEPMLERALAYFIFRHCSDSYDEAEFSARLGFCLFCERLLASFLKFENPKDLTDIIRIAVTVSEEIEYSEENTDDLIFRFYNNSAVKERK